MSSTHVQKRRGSTIRANAANLLNLSADRLVHIRRFHTREMIIARLRIGRFSRNISSWLKHPDLKVIKNRNGNRLRTDNTKIITEAINTRQRSEQTYVRDSYFITNGTKKNQLT